MSRERCDPIARPSSVGPGSPISRRISRAVLIGCIVAGLAGLWDSSREVRARQVGRWLVVVDDLASVDVRVRLRSCRVLTAREIPAAGAFVVMGQPGLERQLAALPGVQLVPIRQDSFQPASGTSDDVTAPRAGVPAGGAAHNAGPPAPHVEHTHRLPVDDDFYFGAQWALTAINAPQAWASGHRGRGVRVAVLDTGCDPTHPDLSANLNVALARSFVTGQSWNVSGDAVQNFDHGTHVTGIIAAADNGFGIIGVAPEAEVVPIQVLRRPSGLGPPDAVLEGIIYAADIGADVINLSLGYTRSRHGGLNGLGTEDPGDDVIYTAQEAAALMKAFSRATSYAHSRGCTIVAAAHNNATDADHDGDGFVLPRDAPHVVSVAATGPLGWSLDPTTALDVPALYSNHGQSIIDLAAPGGNLDFQLLASGELCTVSAGPISVTLPCWFFDGVLSTAPVQGGFLYEFRRGTSMAAAHVSGVAALIIGGNGGRMDPAQVEARLRQSADDLGKPGKDDFYGQGRVNAQRALR